MKYEELFNEKICIFGYSEPLVPYDSAMASCRELLQARKDALAKIRELTVENAKLKESLRRPSGLPEEGGSTSKEWSTHPHDASASPPPEPER